MSVRKFKIGDKVMIDPNVKKNDRGSHYNLTREMYNWRGKIFTIRSYTKYEDDNAYYLDGTRSLGWHEKWLIPIIFLEGELFEL